ncbi:TPA: hypothetical protein HA265_06935 [Candidatus Woesearchaeota archaeon]|nr:hypothetical protein [Candidatus Woesearchaeota archaeon]
MKHWLHKIEVIVDKLIVPMLLLLIVIIVLDLGFPVIAEHYHSYIVIGDTLVIIVFVFDLVFKYIRVRNIPLFIRKFWLDILAVFPFFLLFRVFEGFFGLLSRSFSEGAQTVQSFLHTGLEVEKEGVKVAEVVSKEGGKVIETTTREIARIAREAEKVGKVSRSARFARFIRPIFRLPRFIKALPFFEKPTGEHHIHEYYHPKPQDSKKSDHSSRSVKKR